MSNMLITMAWVFVEVLIIAYTFIQGGLSAGICDVCKCRGTSIDCSSQGLTFVPQDIPRSTTYLSLRGNSIVTINSTSFSTLRQLRYLDIGNNTVSTGQANKIHEDAFADLEMLEHLVMDNCGYLQLPKSLFSHFRNLQTLKLNGNKYLGLKSAVASLKRMKNQSLHLLDLSLLNGYDIYEYAILDNTFFYSISHLSVKELRVNDNNILIIVNGFWKIIPQIELLSLARNNLIGMRKCIVELSFLRELKVLDLSIQSWSVYPQCTKTVLPQGNYIEEPHTSINKFSSDEAYTSGKALAVCSITVSMPPKLEVVLASKFPGRESIDINGYCINKNNNVRYLDISYIYIREIVTPVKGLIHLEYLNIQSCRIEWMHPNMFSDMKSLRVLLLGNNFLFHTIENDKDCIFFRENRNLTTLDLAQNSIRNIPALYFHRLHDVHHINLSMNSIVDVQGAWFMNLTKLSHINLSNNSILYLNTEARNTFDELNRLSKNSKLRVDLTGNPLSCACGKNILFLRWISTTQVHLINKDRYTCRYHNKSTVHLKYVNVDTLENECREKKAQAAMPMIIGSVVALILVLTLVSSLGYRYRWRLRYFLYITCRFWRKHEEMVDNADYEYDAFVAYNRGDAEWVNDSLLPNLEDQAGFKLCIHDRDFLIGSTIEEIIVESIECSRKTILVLSQHFLQSNWCYFEMQMARNRLFMRGQDCLLPILMEDIPLETLGRSSTLRNLLESKTYLKWTANPEGQEFFWKQLKMALEMPNPPLVVN